MATVKVKFRASSVAGKEGSLFYQIIHNRQVFRIQTGYKIYPSEWDDRFVLPAADDRRIDYLNSLQQNTVAETGLLRQIIESLEQHGTDYSFEQILSLYLLSKRACTPANDTDIEPAKKSGSLFGFMSGIIRELKGQNRIRTSETYAAALRSFSRFRNGRDVRLEAIDADLMVAYECSLRMTGVSKNTSSFYMRILRAVYNRAVEQHLTPQRQPFKRVYTGVDKTVKRAVSLEVVRRIRNLELSAEPLMEYARDLFLLSLYTRGMSFVDMAYLKKCDLKDGMLVYRRKKTGQQLHIRWEPCMQEILDKHPPRHPEYLLPIFRNDGGSEFRQYKNMGHLVNRNLKKIGTLLHLPIPLTLYVARHTWASIARGRHIPLSIISEGLGHDSEKTTRIYLASLDTAAVDRANRMVIDLVAKRDE